MKFSELEKYPDEWLSSLTHVDLGREAFPLITLRTEQDVQARTRRGFYNATDLNRVETAVAALSGALNEAGYFVDVTVKTDWTLTDIPTEADTVRYLANVAAIRAVLEVFPTTPQTPESMEFLTWVKANDIEKILADVDTLIGLMRRSIDLGWALGIAHIGIYGGIA